MQIYFLFFVFSIFLTFPKAKAGHFTCGKTYVKKPHTQFTCVTCSLPVKTGKFTCFYAASTSCRIHAIARNKARKLRVTSPAGCRLTYLHFAIEFARGVIADCLQLQVFLCAIADIFSCFAVVFACVWRVFWPATLGFLPANCMYFCPQKQEFLYASRGKICVSSACEITCTKPVIFK